uniref:NUMOD4 domain-containing protein n=1 Tax=Steinernema glaseri TaxID=37863 RepID=A0A1I8ADW2_9BILA
MPYYLQELGGVWKRVEDGRKGVYFSESKD